MRDVTRKQVTETMRRYGYLYASTDPGRAQRMAAMYAIQGYPATLETRHGGWYVVVKGGE